MDSCCDSRRTVCMCEIDTFGCLYTEVMWYHEGPGCISSCHDECATRCERWQSLACDQPAQKQRMIIAIVLEKDDLVLLILIAHDGGASMLERRDALHTSPERFEEAHAVIATFGDGSVRTLKSHGDWHF